jgi:D-amino-acid oxidase
MRTIVIGGGVSGLSTAVALLEAGLTEVRVWARELTPRTTSDIAAAIWHPYLSEPSNRGGAWARATYQELVSLSRLGEIGIALVEGLELFRDPVGDPWWASAVPGLKNLAAPQIPAGFGGAYQYRSPIVEMPVYLYWLMQRVEALGGRIEQRRIESFQEPLAEAEAVVNCSGLAARELASDRSVYAIRGQILRVRKPPGC